MNRAGELILGLGLGLISVAAEPARQDETATPAAQYKALLKEQQAASSSGRVLSDEERMKFIGETFKRWNVIALKFVELAEKHPKDPIAEDALIRAVWQVNSTPWPVELVGKGAARMRAFALLERDHIESEKLGPLCQRISSGYCEEYETFLRAVLEKSPHREVRAQACLALAQFLSSRLQRLDMVVEQPRLAAEFEALVGKEYLARLRHQDRKMAMREVEAFFEQAAEHYGDVKMPEGGTVGAEARAGLFEIRHLTVGVEAPEIEGVDQYGVKFKLTDYRGKVVLLDFWGEY